MSKIKVGDRVRAYERRSSFVGSVSTINNDGTVEIKIDDGGHSVFHPKQLRKLKPKKELRRVWVNPNVGLAAKNGVPEQNYWHGPIAGWVEYVEVRRK